MRLKLTKYGGLLLCLWFLLGVIIPVTMALADGTTVEINNGNTIILPPGTNQGNVPVTIKNIPGLGAGNGVGAFTFTINWNKDVVHVTSATAATLPGFTIVTGTPNNTTGALTIAGFMTTTPLTGSATIANLEVDAVGGPANSATMAVAVKSLGDKDGTTMSAATVGSPVQVTGSSSAPVMMNSSVQTKPLRVMTGSATNVSHSSTTLNGDLSTLGMRPMVKVSFVWGTSPGGPYPNETPAQTKTSSGDYSLDLGNLNPGTSYYFKARAVGNNTVYGAEQSFVTMSGTVSPADAFVQPPPVSSAVTSAVIAQQISVEPSEVAPNKPVKIVAIMTNSGAQQSSYTAKLLINGEVEGAKTVIMAPMTSAAITFKISKSEPGSYIASVADGKTSFVVRSDGPFTVVNIIIACVAVLGLGLTALFIWIRRRRYYY